jgi:hypothetical protein
VLVVEQRAAIEPQLTGSPVEFEQRFIEFEQRAIEQQFQFEPRHSRLVVEQQRALQLEQQRIVELIELVLVVEREQFVERAEFQQLSTVLVEQQRSELQQQRAELEQLEQLVAARQLVAQHEQRSELTPHHRVEEHEVSNEVVNVRRIELAVVWIEFRSQPRLLYRERHGNVVPSRPR